MIAMNIRKHISRRRHSERDMLLRHNRLLTIEMSRKVSLQKMAARNIDKEMGKIQKELIEMRKPSRSWHQKKQKQYKFPVSSPAWKRRRPPRSAPGKNPRRELLSLKSFGDDDDADDDDDGGDCDGDDDGYSVATNRRLSTSETLLLFNEADQDEVEKNVFLNRTNLQPIISEETSIGSETNDGPFAHLNCAISRLDNKTGGHASPRQTGNSVGLSTGSSCHPNTTRKPLVVFSPETISSFVGQFGQGNVAVSARNTNKADNNNLQPVTDRGTTLLPLPPIRQDGTATTTTNVVAGVAAAAVVAGFELPEQSLYPARTLGLRSTADVPVSLPAAIAQESRLSQQLSGHLSPKLMVGSGKDTRETIHRHDNSTHTDNNNNNNNNNNNESNKKNNNNNQQGSLFTVAPDFATLARTSMSSIKKDIARRLSTTAVPAELKRLQNQRNSMNMPESKPKRHSIYADSSSGENTFLSSGQMLLPKKYEATDRRRTSEEVGQHHSGATASFRRLSLNTFRESPQRQEAPVAVVTVKPSESDSSELKIINKPRSEEKPRRKSYHKSLPTYDRELYNPDGSLRTVYCLPSFDECWEQAQQARYIRTREALSRDKELSVDEVFSKHTDSDEGVKESSTDK